MRIVGVFVANGRARDASGTPLRRQIENPGWGRGMLWIAEFGFRSADWNGGRGMGNLERERAFGGTPGLWGELVLVGFSWF